MGGLCHVRKATSAAFLGVFINAHPSQHGAVYRGHFVSGAPTWAGFSDSRGQEWVCHLSAPALCRLAPRSFSPRSSHLPLPAISLQTLMISLRSVTGSLCCCYLEYKLIWLRYWLCSERVGGEVCCSIPLSASLSLSLSLSLCNSLSLTSGFPWNYHSESKQYRRDAGEGCTAALKVRTPLATASVSHPCRLRCKCRPPLGPPSNTYTHKAATASHSYCATRVGAGAWK